MTRRHGKTCTRCHARKVKCDITEQHVPCTNCARHHITDCRIRPRKSERNVFRSAGRPRPLMARSTATDNSGDGNLETGQTDGDVETQALTNFLNQEDVATREISSQGRLYFLGSEISNLNYLLSGILHRTSSKVLHFGSHAIRPTQVNVPEHALMLPSRGAQLELVNLYFDTVNSGFPIVDRADFMAAFRQPDRPRREGKCLSLMLLNAIFVAAAHVMSQDRVDMVRQRNIFAQRTKTLFDARYEEHRECYVQVALLLTWHCANLEDIISNSWHWIGAAARTAFGMGMHRDASNSTLNSMDKRQWPVFFWTIYQYDTVISASYGRPRAINLDETDVPSADSISFHGAHSVRSDFFSAHTHLCLLFGETMKIITSMRSDQLQRSAARIRLDEALARFMIGLPSSLQLNLGNIDIWAATLHSTHNHFLLLVHRPPHGANTDDRVQDSGDIQICAAAATEIVLIFEALHGRGLLSRVWLPGVHALFTAMIHICERLHISQPLEAARCLRILDSGLNVCRAMSGYCKFAASLLNLFQFSREHGLFKPSSRHHNPQEGERPSTAARIEPIGSTEPSSHSFNQGPVGFDNDATPSLTADDLAAFNIPQALEDLLAGFENDFDFVTQ